MHLSRRSLIALPVAASLPVLIGSAQSDEAFQYPIGWPDRAPGDGFVIRHGFVTENTWYNPGSWHTGEDWYAIDDRETGGAEVYAIGPGEVVFAAYDYPGRVVIVRHEADLYSCYGHLDYALDATVGDDVASGDRLGTVLPQRGGRAPSHLHFEVRDFLTTTEVNGSAPRYDVNCGVDCPPGPGYWPIDAPEHPVEMGWLNPTHVIASRTTGAGEVIVAEDAPASVEILDSPDGDSLGEIELDAGQALDLLGIDVGDPMSLESSAESYRLWYEVELPDGDSGWIAALSPSDHDTGSDGRPSSIQFVFLPRSSPDDDQ